MITQLAPSDCSIAHLPAVADRIAVLVPADAKATTLLDALMVALAEMFLRYKMRPVQPVGVGSVRTTCAGENVAPEKIRDESVDVTVYVFVVID